MYFWLQLRFFGDCTTIAHGSALISLRDHQLVEERWMFKQSFEKKNCCLLFDFKSSMILFWLRQRIKLISGCTFCIPTLALLSNVLRHAAAFNTWHTQSPSKQLHFVVFIRKTLRKGESASVGVNLAVCFWSSQSSTFQQWQQQKLASR